MPVAQTTCDLPSPLRRAVDVVGAYAPWAARQIGPTLDVLMRPLLEDLGDARSWRLSLLTDGGYPFELTFTTLGDAVRYTVEVAPPRGTPGTRLRLAQDLLRQLIDGPFDDEAFELLHRLQAGGRPEFGAWVGVRHTAQSTAYKVYAEVPPEAEPQAAAEAHFARYLRRPVGVPNRRHALRMIGLYPATGEVELYFRIFELRPWEIVALMHPIGLEEHHELVQECFQLAHGRPIFQKLPGPVFGFSYALDPADPSRSRAFSLYTFAEAMFGTDAIARRRLLRYCDRAGLEMPGYAAMSAPLERAAGRHTFHGLFGVTVMDGIPPVTSIGLRPPAPVDGALG